MNGMIVNFIKFHLEPLFFYKYFLTNDFSIREVMLIYYLNFHVFFLSFSLFSLFIISLNFISLILIFHNQIKKQQYHHHICNALYRKDLLGLFDNLENMIP